MTHLRNPVLLTNEEIESIERLTLRSIFQAVIDFGFDTWDIFAQSPDRPQDVAEDTTREILDRFGGYHINQRIFGNVDYRMARYIVLPEYGVRQALFVDSKAEKSTSTGTLQMSQISMRVRQVRSGIQVDEPGALPVVSNYRGQDFLTSTMLVHYYYSKPIANHVLKQITISAIPNGKLQSLYNPSPLDTIWLAGRNAPKLGEDFRVRVSYSALQKKANWRVQRIFFTPATIGTGSLTGIWVD